MQVILLEKFQKLGGLGDEVAVKAGYGRNYLIPTGKALPANKASRATFEERRAELEAAAASVHATAEQRMKTVVAAGTLTIKANAGIEGKLFGSIGATDIAEALSAAGADVERNEIRLPEGPLRHVGEYDIDIQLHSDVITTVKVIVASDTAVAEEAFTEEADEEVSAEQITE